MRFVLSRLIQHVECRCPVQIFFDTVPFHGNNDLQVMRLVTNGVCPKRLNIPIMEDYTWNIVQRCWGSNPSGRPTMEDIVKMLIPAA